MERTRAFRRAQLDRRKAFVKTLPWMTSTLTGPPQAADPVAVGKNSSCRGYHGNRCLCNFNKHRRKRGTIEATAMRREVEDGQG